MLKIAFYVIREISDENFELKALHGLGAEYVGVKNSEKANPLLKQAVELATKKGLKAVAGWIIFVLKLFEFTSLARIYATLGISFANDGLPDVALKYYNEGLQMVRQAK